jgi:hypothetical protein
MICAFVTDLTRRSSVAWGLVMGNVYPPLNKGNRLPESHIEDDGFDEDVNSDMILLLEENARLRSLVTQLSSLVLKNVVDQK